MWREENWRTWRKPSEQGENQQQTQPTYGAGPESKPGHIAGGELSHRYAIPAPHDMLSLLALMFCGDLMRFYFFLKTTNLLNVRSLKLLHNHKQTSVT